ncbi:hypothetical protein GCM10020258_42990 [Sphingomonas yabuuchiae]
MNNQGALLACDIDRARLQRLAPRAERAGATIIESRLLNPGREAEMLSDWAAKADGVLIDAPVPEPRPGGAIPRRAGV